MSKATVAKARRKEERLHPKCEQCGENERPKLCPLCSECYHKARSTSEASV